MRRELPSWQKTPISLKGKCQLPSGGIIGHVYTFDKQMLHEKLQQALESHE